MIAAIYARRSNDQPGVAVEAKSVTRQVENALAFAVSRGWTVADEHIFVDDGICGAEFERRPGFMAMMSALKPRPPFNVLVVSEQKSLGRESFETNYTIKRLDLAGVEVVEYVHGRSLIPKNWLDKAMTAVESAADEAHREKTAERMHEAHTRLATKGYVTGARVFGYRNQDVFNGVDEHGRPLRAHVERVIEPVEAEVVRRIFALCAAGKGVKGIAKTLNAEGLPSPRPRPGRPRAWVGSSVRCVLYRELYRGVGIWNKRRQSDRWGRRATSMRPVSDWVTAEMPHLRIVSDDEWAAAHARLGAARQTYIRSTKGKTWGRPPSGIESKYLLSGLMRCGRCGASMTVRSGTHGLGQRFFYMCSSYDHRGPAVCANGLRLPMVVADEAILSKLSYYVLDPLVVDGAIAEALGELRPSRDVLETRRAALEARIRAVESEQANLVSAIAVAGQVDALAQALQERERQRSRLRADLRVLAQEDRVSVADLERIEGDLRARIGEWRELLGGQGALARQVVSQLLDGKIVWTPRKEESRYEFAGRVKFDAAFGGVADVALRKVWYRYRD